MARQSKYPEEFRRQAAALVLDSGRTIRDVGRELGVNHETLRNWVDRMRQERDGGRPSDLAADERAELIRLRRQVAQLELEKEILKKAAVYVGDVCQVPVESSRSMSPSKIFLRPS